MKSPEKPKKKTLRRIVAEKVWNDPTSVKDRQTMLEKWGIKYKPGWIVE